MAANVLQNHNRNPYGSYKDKQHLVLFTADDFYMSLLLFRCSPIALRVMLVLASKLNADGYATASLAELAKSLRTNPSYVNKAILELAKYELIQKKKRSEYWIQPDVFRPALIEV
ncbi:Rrf2 family transcriptional regulator [Spirosoma sp. BT702]|uniref:Rrf2 family transcriptional regulator n=1 Tax=Spirosoma profusum TaxID=2771354 RepID=A0A927AV39_9BACT|nr:helix-turn-helix domain-containing protein [Spirosoma profusum]MBD2704951.1 Rrf2 family transcriptional regulator [Spirosoma profusum]